ncbi:hypothetical protein K438DRAFT_1982567 [Mycena galopus ATCC 62051]|nr:hypothetical protein K438DRAFT_1982567 [Mycena galopus ATCC 62051]
MRPPLSCNVHEIWAKTDGENFTESGPRAHEDANDLGVLLSASGGHSLVDDTPSFRPPSAPLSSPGLPPHAPLPIIEVSASLPPQIQLPVLNIQLIDEAQHGDMDEGEVGSSEEDTKKSFDWTGELRNLNESGGSDRRSFVEQLENAFATPAFETRSLRPAADTSSSSSSFSEQTSSGFHIPHSISDLLDMREPTMATSSVDGHSMDVDVYSASRIVNLKEPTLLPGSDSLGSDDSLLPPRPFASGPSDGQLKVQFKFGGELPTEEKQKEKPRKNPLTLSDIIPPPSHVRAQSLSSLMEEDDSVMKSILAHAEDLPRPRPRVNSDSSARRIALENSRVSMMSMHSRTRSRPQSGISFTGFDSFEEVRRGFEFHNNRPAFYPPPPVASNRRVPHRQQDSVFSIASVSSYGHVTNPGVNDPFEYGLPMPSLRERPSSEDLSVTMSLNVDDTFSFLARDPPQRIRVASDASSFYFKAPTQPSGRGHSRRESNLSVSSQNPPISFYNYNRSFGNPALSENDTSTSGSSLAHQYATYGANGGLKAWAKHRQQSSVDSVMSDYSVGRLGRPGVGDKMFDTAMDHRQPLRAISASPPESRGELRNRSSYDSIIDEERRSSSMEDSLFEKTGHRSSMSSDSVFGYDDDHPPNGHLLPPHQFRPLSVLSFNNSVHSPVKDDDTMISVETIFAAGPSGLFSRRLLASASRNGSTPFSVYALQAFQPPKNPEGMQVLLQHSVQNYGPLPSELGPRRVRSRTQSRASPYPSRNQTAVSPEQQQAQRPSPTELHRAFVTNNTLQAIEVNANADMSPTVLSPKRENAWGLAPNARPRVASAARCSALGWAKRSSTKENQNQKENTSMGGMSFNMTPGESLRLSRSRPRGRPTPARAGAATPRQPIAAI